MTAICFALNLETCRFDTNYNIMLSGYVSEAEFDGLINQCNEILEPLAQDLLEYHKGASASCCFAFSAMSKAQALQSKRKQLLIEVENAVKTFSQTHLRPRKIQAILKNRTIHGHRVHHIDDWIEFNIHPEAIRIE